MRYTTRRHLTGNEAAALSTVETILLPNGFRLTEAGATRLVFKGRGLQSTKENPVRGASEIVVEARGGSLHLNARLGGVRAMASWIRRRTRQALDDLLESAAVNAKR